MVGRVVPYNVRPISGRSRARTTFGDQRDTRGSGPLHWKLCKAGSSGATVFHEVARVGASIGRSDLQPAKETRHERSYRDDECAGKGIFDDDAVDDDDDDDDDPGPRPGEV